MAPPISDIFWIFQYTFEMLTCTYRGVTYEIPMRQRDQQILMLERMAGHSYSNESDKQMIYRGINHELAAK